MKARWFLVIAIVVLFANGSSLAMMTNTGSNMPGGMYGGPSGGTVIGPAGDMNGDQTGGMYGDSANEPIRGPFGGMHGGSSGGAWTRVVGPGYGMHGAGGMTSGMMVQTMRNGYLDILTPIVTPQAAITAVNNFLVATNSSFQIAEVWEYQAVYKAELIDTNGQKAFDVLVDKLTGVVMPEMGFSMIMNASWGRQLQKTPKFGKKLVLSPDAATSVARDFVSTNAAIINYNLATPEVYPGYYKFHTTDVLGKPGMDIMVNGYNGGIWMNTQLSTPIALVYPAP
jgi:hypothetical protein